jgi:hypothetical protein
VNYVGDLSTAAKRGGEKCIIEEGLEFNINNK